MTANGIGPVVQPILPQGILTAKSHMLMKLLTMSTTDGDANDLTYVCKARFNYVQEVGGLVSVLGLLRFTFLDDKVRDHLYSTFRDVSMYLDPEDQSSNDGLHEDLGENVDNEVMMIFLARHLYCDSLGGIKKVFELCDSIPITKAAFALHAKHGTGELSVMYKYRSTRLPRMLATVLSEIQLYGQSKSWAIPDIQQHFRQFIRAFNTIIAPDNNGQARVSVDATPDSIIQSQTHEWIPQFVDTDEELPHVLTNNFFSSLPCC